MKITIKKKFQGRTFLLLNIICFLPTLTFTQVLTLDSVLARIETNNPALLSFTNRINAANELVSGARALPPPKAGVMFDDNPYQFGFDPMIIDLSVSQAFPNSATLNAKEDYLRSLSDIKLKEQELLRNKLFAQAKTNYFERYILERKVIVLNENSALMKSMIEISEKQMESGMGDLGSIYKVKARLAESEAMLLREQSMINSMTTQLNYLMAADLNQTFTLDTNNLLKDYKGTNLLASKEILEENRSDIQKMKSEITSMKLNQKVMSSMSKPEFEIKAKHYILNGKPDTYALEAMVMIPIAPWSAKDYKSKTKSMGYEIDAMEQEKEAMYNMANNMVNMLVIELNTQRKEVDKYTEKVIPAYKKCFDANLLAYRENTGDLMKVILALDDLQMAKMEYLNQLGILLKTQADYEREMQIR